MVPWFRVVAGLVIVADMASVRSSWAAEPGINECLTASEDSIRFAKEKKLRAERNQLLICAARTCPVIVQKECMRRADKANAAIPTVVFQVKDGSGLIIRNARVFMDGEVIAEHLDETPIEVDPGEHTFAFEVPDQPRFERALSFHEGEKDRSEVVAFVRLAMPTIAKTTAEVPAVPAIQEAPRATKADSPDFESHSPSPARSERRDFIDSQRLAALVSGTVGLVSVAIGSYYGVRAISERNNARSICPDDKHCPTQEGVDRWVVATRTGNRATVGFAIGGVGLAAGAALWLTANPTGTGNTQVGLAPRGIQLRGNW